MKGWRRNRQCFKPDKTTVSNMTRMTVVNMTRTSWKVTSCQIVTDISQWMALALTKAILNSTVLRTSKMESRYVRAVLILLCTHTDTHTDTGTHMHTHTHVHTHTHAHTHAHTHTHTHAHTDTHTHAAWFVVIVVHTYVHSYFCHCHSLLSYAGTRLYWSHPVSTVNCGHVDDCNDIRGR